MTDLLHRLAGTVLLRPYVFVFLLAYLFLAVARLGWLRTLVWTVTAYLIAWACEWSSIHNGFPFGRYDYIDRTSDRELWVAGVPFLIRCPLPFFPSSASRRPSSCARR